MPYLRDGNLISFRIPPDLAESLRVSDINIKEVCITALWEAVKRFREDMQGKDGDCGPLFPLVVGPPGFEPGTTSSQGSQPSQASPRPPAHLIKERPIKYSA